MREALHAEFGDALFDDFASVAEKLKAHLDPVEVEIEEIVEGEDEATTDGEDAAEAEAEDATPRLPRKTVKKLLDPATWARDRRLHRAAERLMVLVGDTEYDDYSVFGAKVSAAVKSAKIALKPADVRLIECNELASARREADH